MVTAYEMTQTRRATPVKKPHWALAIELRRTTLQLSQELIAERAEMSQSYYSEIERGARPLDTLTLRKLVRLAAALEWSLPELQHTTGVDLGVASLALVGEGSADVYPMSAACTPDTPGPALSHEAVAPGITTPLLLQFDSDEMTGTGRASIRPGSVLHVDRDVTELIEGHVYVVCDGQHAYCRIYSQSRLGTVFRPENRTYDDLPAAEVTVVGKVITVATDYNPNIN